MTTESRQGSTTVSTVFPNLVDIVKVPVLHLLQGTGSLRLGQQTAKQNGSWVIRRCKEGMELGLLRTGKPKKKKKKKKIWIMMQW